MNIKPCFVEFFDPQMEGYINAKRYHYL